MRSLTMYAVFVSCAWAQSGLDRPVLGQMIDRQQRLRPVYGTAGIFSPGASVAERVLSSACSATLCLAKTETSLVANGRTTASPPGDAKIALDTTGATIYFVQTGQFARWQHGSLTKLDLHVDGAVRSLGHGSSGLSIAVERSGSEWIVSADGTILDSLPPDAGAVVLLPKATVYATPDSLVLRKSDGSELRFPAPGVATLTAMGDGYVEAAAGGILYALRTVPGREQLFQLPKTYTEPRR